MDDPSMDGNGKVGGTGDGARPLTRGPIQPSGLTAREEGILARRVAKATMAETKAGARAARSLDRCVELLEGHLAGDVGLDQTRKTSDTLLKIAERSSRLHGKTDAVDGGQHLHIHTVELKPDALEAALGHMRDSRTGPRANGTG